MDLFLLPGDKFSKDYKSVYMRGKTIQIFLPDGNARSIKIAEITSQIVQAIHIPRNKLSEAGKREEINNVGIYFLFGEDEEKSKPLVYIGEAENCCNRLKQHNQNKDFWTHAVVIVTKTSSFTKSHVKFLENYCVNKASEINRFILENNVNPTKSHITEQMEADIMDVYDTMKILLSTLGYPIFEEIKPKTSNKDLLYCKGKQALAIGELTDDGILVYSGSKANVEETRSLDKRLSNMRKRLFNDGIIKLNNGVYLFQKDHLFSSVSTAATCILAGAANGWTAWKNKEGKTLDELKRK